MKISSAQHVTILWKNKRIIGDRSQLAFKNVGAIVQGIAYSAENLGRAAHCIGVLYPGAISMAGVDLAITYQFSQSSGADLLPLLAPAHVNTRIQGYMTAHQTLDTHGTCNLSRAQERLSVGECQYRNGLHHVRAIDERKPFFCLQVERCKACPL